MATELVMFVAMVEVQIIPMQTNGACWRFGDCRSGVKNNRTWVTRVFKLHS